MKSKYRKVFHQTVILLLWSASILYRNEATENQKHVFKRMEGIPVLAYHQVASDNWATFRNNPYILGVTQFKEQINWLKDRGYQTVSLHQFQKYISKKSKLKIKKPVLITFDDGTKGFYRFARPILKEAGFKAVLFIYPGTTSKFRNFLTWKQLSVIDTDKHEIENHTFFHTKLSRYDVKRQRLTLHAAQKSIYNNLNRRTRWVAYPFGAFNDKSILALKQSGHHGAFTVFPGDNLPGQNFNFLNRYLVLRQHSFFKFQTQMRIKSLLIKKANPRPGSKITIMNTLSIQLEHKVLKESVRVEAGRRFTGKNRIHDFSYDEENRTIFIRPRRRTKTFLVINIYARDRQNQDRQATILYLWR